MKSISSIIENQGYISLYDFLKTTITYYYSNNTAIGQDGDFITAPEISQMFGETIALYILSQYQYNSLDNASLLELGPGRGVLMHDIMRTITKFSKSNITHTYMLEISEKMRAAQRGKLGMFHNISWVDSIDEINAENLFIVGNEFFDALPIKQIEQAEDGCYEIIVSSNKEDQLVLNKVKIGNHKMFSKLGIYELSPDIQHIVSTISTLKSKNIFCVFIDYGYATHPGTSTIQAVYKHKNIDFLQKVGEADITSLVDFRNLAAEFIKNGFECQVLTQSDFLKYNGIELRAKQLINNGANRTEIATALERLISEAQMGTIFKVLLANRLKNS